MSTDADRPSPFINPRPGVVKTLGVLNITFSVMIILLSMTTVPILFVAASQRTPRLELTVTAEVKPTAPPPTNPKVTAFVNPMMGIVEPTYIRFMYVDLITSLIINGVMFATGLGLVNLKRWAAVWWTRLAWLKIVRLFLTCGYFIIVVGPALSMSMATAVASQVQVRPGQGQGQPSPVTVLTHVYGVMCLIMGLGMVVLGSIYPAFSLWLIRKPEVQAALVDGPLEEATSP